MSKPSLTLNIFINRLPESVYSYVSRPQNLPQWAPAFCKGIRQVDHDWIVDTVQGPVRVRIAAPNTHGILDHYIYMPGGVEIYVPMRVVPFAGGSEIIFTLLRRPEMTDEQFAEDQRLVASDLATLKKVMEG